MIEKIKARLPLPALTEAMRRDGYSAQQTEIGINDYCRLLALLAVVGGTLRPTKLGDEILHRHIEMPGFDDDCLDIVGATIAHTPHQSETPDLTAAWQQTRRLTLAAFGIDPETIGNDNPLPGTVGANAAICTVSGDNAAICTVSVDNAAICTASVDNAAICTASVDNAAICTASVDNAAICTVSSLEKAA